ncbi:MAG: xanthine dehydrogenase family protein molybdopterin-binding subunit [Desulfobacterales bacterium]|nr:xanthine dehydrogenase family protein molybdopterin-binding subunit [Desulfobacterales bacterium]
MNGKNINADFRYLGKSLPVIGGRDKVAGRAVYAGDMQLPNMIHGKVLYSPLSHARIRHIDVSWALKHPGVRAVVTAADTLGLKAGRCYKTRPILADGEVNYIGEPVAAVAAVDEDTAMEALELIRVEYEELPPVFDPLAAMEPDSPLVHADVDTFEPFPPQRDGRGNILDKVVIQKGNVEEALKESYLVHQDTYRTKAQHAGYIEPQAVLAHVDASGKATIWNSTKAVHVIRADVARLLGLPLSKVRVIAPAVGGDFGGKGGIVLQPVCVLLSMKAQLPVRLVLNRREDFACTFWREATVSNLTIGTDRDGSLKAIKGQIVFECGAYSDIVTRVSPANLHGPYTFPNVDLVAYRVFTNNPPRGQVRAPSFPAPTFALESHMDMLARKLNMDPIEFRLKNAAGEGYQIPGGKGYLGTTAIRQVLNAAADYLKKEKTPQEKYRGWGVSCSQWGAHSWHTPAQASSAWVAVNKDGSVVLVTGVTDQGGGQYGAFAQIVAEILSVPFESVSVVAADTDVTPYEGGTGGSRTTYRVGSSVKLAAEDVRGEILKRASEKLEAPVEILELKDGRVYVREDPGRSVSFSALAAESLTSDRGMIIGNGARLREKKIAQDLKRKGEIDTGACSTHVARVEVDPATGKVKVLKYFAAHDVGFAIHPDNVANQIEGGVAFGLGYALTEEAKVEQGRCLNNNFSDYKLPGITMTPHVEKAIIQVPSSFGPYGVRGVGEPPNVLVAPAVANAVCDALGVRVTELPLTPERVFSALKKKHAA